VQKEALSVMSKATELFVAYVAKRSGIVATSRGVKTVKSSDFIKAIHDDDILSFLAEDFPLSSLTTKANNKRALDANDADGSDEANKKSRKIENVATGKSSLHSYFGGNKTNN
jgi:hypothetical protein